MRKIFLGVFVLTTFFIAAALWSQKSRSRIELLEDRDTSTVELRRRVRILQETVIDLDDRLARLEARVGVAPAAEAQHITCYIETPFDGLFDATEVNETKARVEAVKSCMSKVKSRIHCSAEKVKCGH